MCLLKKRASPMTHTHLSHFSLQHTQILRQYLLILRTKGSQKIELNRYVVGPVDSLETSKKTFQYVKFDESMSLRTLI